MSYWYPVPHTNAIGEGADKGVLSPGSMFKPGCFSIANTWQDRF